MAGVTVEGGEETVRLIKNAGGEAIFVNTNVSKAASAPLTLPSAVVQ